jgi:hypothetical protein
VDLIIRAEDDEPIEIEVNNFQSGAMWNWDQHIRETDGPADELGAPVRLYVDLMIARAQEYKAGLQSLPLKVAAPSKRPDLRVISGEFTHPDPRVDQVLEFLRYTAVSNPAQWISELYLYHGLFPGADHALAYSDLDSILTHHAYGIERRQIGKKSPEYRMNLERAARFLLWRRLEDLTPLETLRKTDWPMWMKALERSTRSFTGEAMTAERLRKIFIVPKSDLGVGTFFPSFENPNEVPHKSALIRILYYRILQDLGSQSAETAWLESFQTTLRFAAVMGQEEFSYATHRLRTAIDAAITNVNLKPQIVLSVAILRKMLDSRQAYERLSKETEEEWRFATILRRDS